MILTERLRKLALSAHLIFSIGWLGVVVAFLALAITGVTSQNTQMVRAACLAMGLMMSYVIVPFAFTSLASGLLSALGTKWGLFRHYWVVIKLVLTIVSIIVLMIQVPPINHVADLASDVTSSISALQEGLRRPLIHAAGGLVVLLVVQVLGVYKPWGRTRQRTSQAPVGVR